MRRRAGMAALMATAMTLAVPAVSQAGTVFLEQESLDHGEYRYWLIYAAETGEQNTLRVTQAAMPYGSYAYRVVVEDSTAPVQAGDFCVADASTRSSATLRTARGTASSWARSSSSTATTRWSATP